ncbi:MAG: hypothetical protein H0Z29_11345 [Candidatus Marinimicrobia bacterium]|nr:hypothetical protein [Candidatus Neomarinimicrobiota bacterium]
MDLIIKACFVIGIVSLIMGIISRMLLVPFFVEANAYLSFSEFCFIVAIAFMLYKIAYKK